jgi:hypothetical protein
MFQNDFKKQVQIFQEKLNNEKVNMGQVNTAQVNTAQVNTEQVKQVNNGRIPMDIDTINSFPNIIPVQTICPVPMEIDEPKKRVNMEID